MCRNIAVNSRQVSPERDEHRVLRAQVDERAGVGAGEQAADAALEHLDHEDRRR